MNVNMAEHASIILYIKVLSVFCLVAYTESILEPPVVKPWSANKLFPDLIYKEFDRLANDEYVSLEVAGNKTVTSNLPEMTCPSELTDELQGSKECLLVFYPERCQSGDPQRCSKLTWYERVISVRCDQKYKRIGFECNGNIQNATEASSNLGYLVDGRNDTIWARKIVHGQDVKLTIHLAEKYRPVAISAAMETIPVWMNISITDGDGPEIQVVRLQTEECPASNDQFGRLCRSWSRVDLPGAIAVEPFFGGKDVFERPVADKVHITLSGETQADGSVYKVNYHAISDVKISALCACEKGSCSVPDMMDERSVKANYSCTCRPGYTGFLCNACSFDSYEQNGDCIGCGCGEGALDGTCNADGVCKCDPEKAPLTRLNDEKCKIPYITQIFPMRGPLAGNTAIDISGGLLLNWGVPDWLKCDNRESCRGDAACIERLWTNRKCITLAASTPTTYSIQHGKDSVNGANKSIEFNYVTNPNISSLYPSEAFLSGGRQLTITGSNLDSVRLVSLVYEINCKNTEKLKHTMTIDSCESKAAAETICLSPNFTDTLQRCEQQTRNEPKQQISQHTLDRIDVSVGLKLDGLEDFLSFKNIAWLSTYASFTITKDPIIFHWDNFLRQMSLQQTTVNVPGRLLHSGAAIDDYMVTIDGITCTNKMLNSDSLVVELPQSKPSGRAEARIGFHYKYLGEVTYNKDIVAAYVLGPVAAVIIIALIIVCCIQKRSSSLKRKTTGERQQLNQYTKGFGYSSTVHGFMMNNPQIFEVLKPWLVSRDQINMTTVLGQGQFGRVYKGSLQTDQRGYLEIAAKTLKAHEDNITSNAISEFLEEATLMSNFSHANVLSLIGVVYEDDIIPIVLLPYMELGDIRSMLKKDEVFTLGDLLHFGLQTSRGMEYLADMKFVHRDLAARNCMVNGDCIVKIADFGLSRDIYESDYYTSDESNSKPLPVKWMAIESLLSGRFTTESDVWSYGVLLWEILTRGVNPYPDVSNYYIKEHLQTGERLDKPHHCPDSIYGLMTTCWHEEPSARPTFTYLCDQIEAVLKIGKYEARSKTKSISSDYNVIPSPHYVEILSG